MSDGKGITGKGIMISLVFVLYIVILASIAIPYCFPDDPATRNFDHSLTSLVITGALGLFAVFALLSGWYFEKIEKLQERSQQTMERLGLTTNELDKYKNELDELKKKSQSQINMLTRQYQLSNAQYDMLEDSLYRLARTFFQDADYTTACELFVGRKRAFYDHIFNLISLVKIQKKSPGQVNDEAIFIALEDLKSFVQEHPVRERVKELYAFLMSDEYSIEEKKERLESGYPDHKLSATDKFTQEIMIQLLKKNRDQSPEQPKKD
jgi:hypothetical protein